MLVFVCTNHDGHWPVGVASVVVAENDVRARNLLDAKLKEHGLRDSDESPYDLRRVDCTKEAALVLHDGDY
jgi:hypothetical protein